MCGQVPPKGSRKHGLQSPLQPYQILVWGTIASSIILFFVLCVPFIANDTQRGIFTGLYLLIMVVGLASFFKVSMSDPALRNGTLPAGEGVVSKQCTTCGSTMTPSTKHCYHCHKCVEGFDHHCLYLNTCIGTYNYTSFFLLISCLSTLVFLQSCVIALLLATYSSPEVAANTQWTVLGPKGYMILLAATSFIPIGGFLLVLSLLGFHAWIICWGITTYNWILDRRQKNQVKQDAKAEKKAAKLKQTEEQKTLITKEGNKTVIVEPTATGGVTTTTITSRPISPSASVSFPLQTNSLLSVNAPSQPLTATSKTANSSVVSLHLPTPPVIIHPPPSPVAVPVVQTTIEMTPATTLRGSVSFRHEGLVDADQEDVLVENEPEDGNCVMVDRRGSVSVERPLSYLGIDLGEKPLQRHSRTGSMRLSV